MAKTTENGFIISEGNRKMGKVSSFSVAAVATCPPEAPCFHSCYASKMMRIWSTVRRSYQKNTKLLKEEEKYEELYADVVKYIKTRSCKLFRWNVSGDIFSERYLETMIRIAKDCPDTKFWVFTKQFKILGEYYKKISYMGMKLPKNLNIILSSWGDYVPPEELKKVFGVNYFGDKDGKYEIPTDAFVCEGNCEECQHCADIKGGESMVIHQH